MVAQTRMTGDLSVSVMVANGAMVPDMREPWRDDTGIQVDRLQIKQQSLEQQKA
jgi:hypothetical protein